MSSSEISTLSLSDERCCCIRLFEDFNDYDKIHVAYVIIHFYRFIRSYSALDRQNSIRILIELKQCCNDVVLRDKLSLIVYKLRDKLMYRIGYSRNDRADTKILDNYFLTVSFAFGLRSLLVNFEKTDDEIYDLFLNEIDFCQRVCGFDSPYRFHLYYIAYVLLDYKRLKQVYDIEVDLKVHREQMMMQLGLEIDVFITSDANILETTRKYIDDVCSIINSTYSDRITASKIDNSLIRDQVIKSLKKIIT